MLDLDLLVCCWNDLVVFDCGCCLICWARRRGAFCLHVFVVLSLMVGVWVLLLVVCCFDLVLWCSVWCWHLV